MSVGRFVPLDAIIYGRLLSKEIWPTTGILTGAMAFHYQVDSTMHSDDLNATVYGVDSRQVCQHLGEVATNALDVFKDLHIAIERNELFYITSDDNTDHWSARTSLRSLEGTLLGRCGVLKLGYALGSRKRHGVIKGRV